MKIWIIVLVIAFCFGVFFYLVKKFFKNIYNKNIDIYKRELKNIDKYAEIAMRDAKRAGEKARAEIDKIANGEK